MASVVVPFFFPPLYSFEKQKQKKSYLVSLAFLQPIPMNCLFTFLDFTGKTEKDEKTKREFVCVRRSTTNFPGKK